MGIPFSTQTGSVKMVQRFGEHERTQGPGLSCLWLPCCCVDSIAGTVSLRVQQVDINCETKTKDNVFVKVSVGVQFRVIPERIEESFYQLTNVRHQLTAYIYDVLRAEVPKTTLDDLFVTKDHLAQELQKGVGQKMEDFGFEILATPITDIDPDLGVKKAMNEINRQERLKKAASDKGEAMKIVMIKEAEARAARIRIEAQADADAKELAGQGLSRQRQAIVDGLQESVNLFTKGVPGADPSTVMDMIMITQYFDTMKDIGSNSRSNAIFMPHQPGAVADLSSQLRQGILEASFVPPADISAPVQTTMSRGAAAATQLEAVGTVGGARPNARPAPGGARMRAK